MSDPFLLDQAALESKLKLLQENFDRWRQIRDCRDVAEFVASADEFNWLCVELSQGIKNAGWDLDDLEETLKLMTESRQLAINEAEQRTRRQFIANTRLLLSQISGEVQPASGRPGGQAAAAAAGTRRGVGDSELLTTKIVRGSGSINTGDHFAEEPASLDLLGPSDYEAGGGVGGGRTAVASWRRRLGAAVTFGPLRQIGLADSGAEGGGSSGGCWGCLMRQRFRLLAVVAVALLLVLLIAGIATAVQRNRTGGGAANFTLSIANVTTYSSTITRAATTKSR